MKKKIINKKSNIPMWYKILIGILSLIFSILLCSFIGILLTEEYGEHLYPVDMYYYLASEDIYSPFDVYEHAVKNDALSGNDSEDMRQISAYGYYYMHSLHYHGSRNPEKKEAYKEAMEQDINNMGEIKGLKYRIDRYFER